MIELTRLNGSPLAVNCDLIKYVESSPDTTLTLATGDKIVVRESPGEIIARAIAHRARVLKETGAAGLESRAAHASAAAVSAHAAHPIPQCAADEQKPQHSK